MTFQPDQDPARLGDFRRLHQGVAHQNEIFLLSGPLRFWSLVGVDNRGAAFRGEANRLLEVFRPNFRFAQGSV